MYTTELDYDPEQANYKAYNLKNFRTIPQVQEYLSEEDQFAIEVVGNVLPFKANSYVINELINWDEVPNDPIFRLTFPDRELLSDAQYRRMESVLSNPDHTRDELKKTANAIRMELNPHPAGQLEMNRPMLNDGTFLDGMQHKYKETVLFFPSQGQTCHAYCTFCFRWPQFVGMDGMKIAMKEVDLLIRYLEEHPEVTDILFTGGDPMIMRTKIFKTYIDAILNAGLSHIRTIRIGTKALSYWPYRFVTDSDADDLLAVFKHITDAGLQLALMGHFSHGVELRTNAVREAIKRIRATGAQIRTQSPLLTNINDSAGIWVDMWREQVRQGLIPYYMFVVRDTGAQDYFGVSLDRAYRIYRHAATRVSGVARTVRGPSMSAGPGKIEVVGTQQINGEDVFVLRFLQGRNPDWSYRPFFAKHDPEAIWIDDLEPYGGDEFFYEAEYRKLQEPRPIQINL